MVSKQVESRSSTEKLTSHKALRAGSHPTYYLGIPPEIGPQSERSADDISTTHNRVENAALDSRWPNPLSQNTR
jgi:hypothetical protein